MRKSAPIILKGKIQGFKKCKKDVKNVCPESELSEFKLEMVGPAPGLEELQMHKGSMHQPY